MRDIGLLSFAKINLSIDVGERKENGYHDVDMLLQQLSFHDDVRVAYEPSDADIGSPEGGRADGGSFDIKVRTNKYYLPVDERNLAYRAAALMGEEYSGKVSPGKITIDIKKRIPVAGGLAGGSGNAAAVIHALNVIWGLEERLGRLAEIAAKLGSDVPYCVYGQARSNRNLPDYIRNDEMAASCMRATGRGTELVPVKPFSSWIVIAKPRLSVSTREVYEGIDDVPKGERPDNDRLTAALEGGAPRGDIYKDFINVLECYTLRKYPEVKELKDAMEEAGAEKALMSGSGPTVFGTFSTLGRAKKGSDALRALGYEAYWTKTTV